MCIGNTMSISSHHSPKIHHLFPGFFVTPSRHGNPIRHAAALVYPAIFLLPAPPNDQVSFTYFSLSNRPGVRSLLFIRLLIVMKSSVFFVLALSLAAGAFPQAASPSSSDTDTALAAAGTKGNAKVSVTTFVLHLFR